MSLQLVTITELTFTYFERQSDGVLPIIITICPQFETITNIKHATILTPSASEAGNVKTLNSYE